MFVRRPVDFLPLPPEVAGIVENNLRHIISGVGLAIFFTGRLPSLSKGMRVFPSQLFFLSHGF